MSKSISVSGIAPFYHLNIESENGSAISQNVNLLSQTSREEFEQVLIRLRTEAVLIDDQNLAAGIAVAPENQAENENQVTKDLNEIQAKFRNRLELQNNLTIILSYIAIYLPLRKHTNIENYIEFIIYIAVALLSTINTYRCRTNLESSITTVKTHLITEQDKIDLLSSVVHSTYLDRCKALLEAYRKAEESEDEGLIQQIEDQLDQHCQDKLAELKGINDRFNKPE